jgi:hypothetical protein
MMVCAKTSNPQSNHHVTEKNGIRSEEKTVTKVYTRPFFT